MEATFFSSREVSAFYQTEPLLGNYALAYALRLCESNYYNDGTIHYVEHLKALNARGIYITPGTFVGQPQFLLRTLNAQSDAYWSEYGQGFIAVRPEHGWTTIERGQLKPVDESGQIGSRFRAVNRPQHGRIRLLAIGNRAQCYVISQAEPDLPEYIRLGKFMSKAHVEYERVTFQMVENQRHTIPPLLNPADLSSHSQLLLFDMISVPPTPLVRNAVIEGAFYQIAGNEWLPAGMKFGIERLL
jgi:CRISPR-associated protein Csc1